MPLESRKIFISWSKAPTDVIATALAQFLKHMFDNVKPFVSKDNVQFGSLSIGEIHRELSGTSFGILVVTKQNQSEPWLNFEAGSLAKTIPDSTDARVVPLLIDHTSMAQLEGPIANLQAVMADEQSIRRLMNELADSLVMDSAVFDSRWDTGWNRFEKVLDRARQEIAAGPQVPERTPDDMLEEILTLLRTANRPSPVAAKASSRAKLSSDQGLITVIADLYGLEVRDIRYAESNGTPTMTILVGEASEAQLEDLRVSVLRQFPGRNVRVMARRITQDDPGSVD